MNRSIQRFFVMAIGVLLCVLGCTRDQGHLLMPDHIEVTDTEAAFKQNVQPILTARCALTGCHVADGPHGLDFRTYASFMVGGEHGPVFIPGDAAASEIVEEIVEGHMPPPPREPPSDAELQAIIDWINHQEHHEGMDPHDDVHDEHAEAHDEHADEHEDMAEEHHDVHDEDLDVEHHDDDDAN